MFIRFKCRYRPIPALGELKLSKIELDLESGAKPGVKPGVENSNPGLARNRTHCRLPSHHPVRNVYQALTPCEGFMDRGNSPMVTLAIPYAPESHDTSPRVRSVALSCTIRLAGSD